MENTELAPSKPHQLVDAVDYLPGSIVIKSILHKKTGTVKMSSFDAGEILAAKISPYDNLVQVIGGVAEVVIDEKSTQLETGQVMIIPAHSTNKMKANERFKILSTVIKSGYEDVTLWNQELMRDEKENKYVAGDTVYAKVNPKVKLVVRRYIDRIYYCQFPNEPERKELALFERELV